MTPAPTTWGTPAWPLFDWGPPTGYRVHWDWRLPDPTGEGMQRAMLACWHLGVGGAGNVRFTNGPLPAQYPSTFLLLMAGVDLSYYTDPGSGQQPAGLAPDDVSRVGSWNLWDFRVALLDTRYCPTPEAVGVLAYHELGHAFGVFDHRHLNMPPRPGYAEELRGRVEVAKRLRDAVTRAAS